MNLSKVSESQWLYYGLIFIISVVALFFLPFLGSEIGIEFTLPNTAAGWAVFAITKGVGGIINVLMFHFFIQQAKLNIKDNKRFVEANEILGRIQNKISKPRSPKQYFGREYSIKGITIFITTVASTFALTNAILTFDWVTFLTYVFTVLFGLVFGIAQMKKTEIYWTEEYYNYAKSMEGINND